MTDRTLSTPDDLARLAFDDRGLVPVVAQDADDGRVLMVAWASREALERSLATGDLHFWSRSRKSLWQKGESSGDTLAVRSLHADCDADTVLALVTPAGPACHTGDGSCFGRHAAPGATPDAEPDGFGADPLIDLWSVIDDRAARMPEGSYTTKLLSDENLRLKKLGEECAEFVTALARGDRGNTAEEAADLVYHVLVAIRGAGVDLGTVLDVLRSRRHG